MTSTLAVLGPGALGLSAAQWAVECGLEVRLLGRDLEHARRGVRTIQARWEAARLKGALPKEARALAHTRLHAAAFSREGLEGIRFLLEALPEDPGLKASALAKTASWGSPDLALLSGTSALPITDLAEAAGVRGRLVGFHLFVPVPRMAVVEVAAPPKTPPDLLDRARSLGEALHKRVVAVKDQPGLAAARMAEALFRATGEARFEPPALLRDLVAQGLVGRKAGRGFYSWDPYGRRR